MSARAAAFLLIVVAVAMLVMARRPPRAGGRAVRGAHPVPALVRLGAAVPAPAGLAALARTRLREGIIASAGLDDALDPIRLGRAQAGAATAAVALLAPLAVAAPAMAVAVPGLALVAWLAPVRAVASRGRARAAEIRAQLPDLLDLLALSVESGMAVDPALRVSAERLGGALGEEVDVTLRDIALGSTRRAAYTDLARRAGLEEVGQLVGALLHADELGAPLSVALRAQAESARDARRRHARDAAARAAPAIQLVVALLMVPAAMVLVIAVMVTELLRRIGPVFGGLG